MPPPPDHPTQPQAAARGWQRLLPRTLFARVTLLIVVAMAIAQLMTFTAVRYERGLAMQDLMLSGIERDIASSVAILDRLPAAERAQWLGRLERRNYVFTLDGAVDASQPPSSPEMRRFTETLERALQPFPVVAVGEVPALRQAVRMQVRLGDGSSVFVLARRVGMPLSDWVLWGLLAQLAVLVLVAWLAVRLVTRPLARLAGAADELGPDLQGAALDETGPAEVARAARAFNAMQRRIAGYMQERVEILAAVSHDLQTPITRMRLRMELIDHLPEREKFGQDLDAMRALVQEGVRYARTLHGTSEAPLRLDLDALLESIVNDYADTGMPVRLDGRVGVPLLARPHALRRVLGNLIDNALKFGTEVQVRVQQDDAGTSISVLDDGPGIPEAELEDVFKPFYRVEQSRNRDTGGTGLGLAIAQQLAVSMGARLSLRNRPEGGLAATLRLVR